MNMGLMSIWVGTSGPRLVNFEQLAIRLELHLESSLRLDLHVLLCQQALHPVNRLHFVLLQFDSVVEHSATLRAQTLRLGPRGQVLAGEVFLVLLDVLGDYK